MDTGNNQFNSYDIDPELLKEFIIESREGLQQVENNLILLEAAPNKLEIISALFRVIHSIKGNSAYFNLIAVKNLSHKLENLLQDLRGEKIPVSSKVVEILLAGHDRLQQIFNDVDAGKLGIELDKADESLIKDIETLRTGALSKETLYHDLIKSIESLKARMELADGLNTAEINAELNEILDKNRPFLNTADEIKPDTPQKKQPQNNDCAEKSSAGDRTMRISEKKIDEFFGSVGDLITIGEGLKFIQNKMNNTPDIEQTIRLFAKYNIMFNKLSLQLQSNLLELRKIPIRHAFQKIPKLVRETARSLEKDVACEITGDDVLIDKSLIELIESPLAHLIRNALDHGIECPAQRLKAGKEKTGNIFVRAKSEQSYIHIEIEDDGKGLDPEKIAQKAIEKKLADEKQVSSMSDSQILQYIFYPGFSTKTEVSDISGRGVGLDVVNDCIRKANGNVEVVSQTGKGTKFTLKLPVSNIVVVIDGLVVQAGNEKYIIPVKYIDESF